MRLTQLAQQTTQRRAQLGGERGAIDSEIEDLLARRAAGEMRFETLDAELAVAQERHARLDEAAHACELSVAQGRDEASALDRKAQEAQFELRAFVARRAELERSIATALQQHPYTFFSLEKKPIRKAEDMVGKKIGIQATGKILLTALLKKHNIPEKDVEVVVVGADFTPLLTGQVDAFTGWLTSTTAIKALGQPPVTLRLWDAGVQLYALPLYATKDTIAKKPGMLDGFLKGIARGYAFAQKDPEKAADLLVKEYPNFKRDDELEGLKMLLTFAFNENTKANGWGAFDPAVWADQIKLYDDLKQFTAGAPKLDDVITTSILDATKDVRSKIG